MSRLVGVVLVLMLASSFVGATEPWEAVVITDDSSVVDGCQAKSFFEKGSTDKPSSDVELKERAWKRHCDHVLILPGKKANKLNYKGYACRIIKPTTNSDDVKGCTHLETIKMEPDYAGANTAAAIGVLFGGNGKRDHDPVVTVGHLVGRAWYNPQANRVYILSVGTSGYAEAYHCPDVPVEASTVSNQP